LFGDEGLKIAFRTATLVTRGIPLCISQSLVRSILRSEPRLDFFFCRLHRLSAKMAASEVCRSFGTELVTLALMTTILMTRLSAAGFNDSLALTREQLLNSGLVQENLHVDYLEKQLDRLEAELNELSPVIDKFTLTLLWLRIVNLEGN
jgi:hypothetical protein